MDLVHTMIYVNPTTRQRRLTFADKLSSCIDGRDGSRWAPRKKWCETLAAYLCGLFHRLARYERLDATVTGDKAVIGGHEIALGPRALRRWTGKVELGVRPISTPPLPRARRVYLITINGIEDVGRTIVRADF